MHRLMLVMSVLTAAMAGYAVFRIFTGSWGFLIGVLSFAGVSYGTARAWASTGADQKLAEETHGHRWPTIPIRAGSRSQAGVQRLLY